MPRPKPNKLHDDLDALLDGRPVELSDELAPLAETAGAIRYELAAIQLDPEVADRHLERVLDGSATVVRMPVRQQPSGWDLRRRVAAIALAAALVLAPATMASAAALPGQAMYPLKLAIEQVRLASVMWSPAREAGERTRVADERLGELERLVDLQMFNQVLPAIRALNNAVLAAIAAVEEADKEGAPVAAVKSQLNQVKDDGTVIVRQAASTVAAQQLRVVSDATREAIQAAVQVSEQILAQPGRPVVKAGSSTSTTVATPPVVTPEPPNPSTEITQPPVITPTTQPTSPPTTSPPTTSPPTTDPPTTDPPTTVAPPESAGGAPEADGRSDVPPTTVPDP